MIENFIERIFWIQDQLKLRYWQEKRLHHALCMGQFYNELILKFDNLVKAYLSGDKDIIISKELYVIENDVDINEIIFETKEFLEYIKTHKEGWGGGMQSIIDDILAAVEIFANTINKQ